MRNRIFGWIMTVGFVVGGGEVAAQEPLRQGPQEEGVVLRFDEARRDTLADVLSATEETLPAAAGRPFAYKLNRRRVTREEAYGRVTLWNVRRVRVKNRRMRLADTTRRERVRLLKFFVERDRRKGVRPHLQGNVAGYRWSATSLEGARQRRQAVHIRTYTLRAEYDSLRRAGGIDRSGRIPDGLWHPLPHDARYLLDGIEVPGRVFQFIDGLILRSLDIRTDSGDDRRTSARRRENLCRPCAAGRDRRNAVGCRRVAADVSGERLLVGGGGSDVLLLPAARRSGRNLRPARPVRRRLHRTGALREKMRRMKIS